jgi:DNA-binding NarL/FixJ family response regulator
MARTSAYPPFAGRQRELGTLLAHLDAARTGQSGLVLIGGEPGIGKTRLTHELAGRAHGQGWCVLIGRASQSEVMAPYLPFREPLAEYVRGCPIEDLRRLLGKGAAEVALLLPDVRERLPDLQPSPPLAPDYERYRLFESLTDFLIAIAHSSTVGLLLILDDLHAADRPTLLLLHHLLRRLDDAPVLVVGTYRTVDVDDPHVLQDVLAEISRDAPYQRVLLTPLSADAVAAMVQGMAGTPAAAAVAEVIHRESGGNPFFVREIVQHLQAEERDLTNPQLAAADWGIPEGIRFVIGKRLWRLGAATTRLLHAIAVLGDGFSFDVIAAVSGVDEEAGLDAVDEALRAGVLREENGAYHFSHTLIRDALLAELTLPRRQRLHLRAAETLERLHADRLRTYLPAIASHYRMSGSVAAQAKVYDFARRAGAAAAAVFAWEEAVAHWRTAVELLDEQGIESVERCDLLLELGRAQGRMGDVSGARERFQEAAALARRLGSPGALAQAALGYGEVYVTGSEVDAYLVGLLEEALAGLDRGDSALRARVLAGLAMALRYAPETARRATHVREAVAVARRAGDPAALSYALTAMHVANWQPGNVAERLDAATEAVRLAEATASRELACWGHHWRAIDLLEMGDIDALDVELDAHRRLAEELRVSYFLWNSLRLRATRAIMGGALEAGERLAVQALDIGRRVDPVDAQAMYTTQVWNIRLWQGRLEESLADWERYCEYYRAIPAWRARLAWMYAETGRAADARRELDRLAPNRFAALPREMHWLAGVTFLVEACVRIGDRRHAATLYELLQPFAGFNVRSGGYPVSLACFGSASRPLGMLAAMLGDWAAAAQHFDEAVAMNTRMRAWPWVAHAQHAYAAMLLAHHARGNLPRARELLEQAIAQYDRLGMTRFADEARALLPAPRPAPVPAGRVYPDRLTPREVDVVQLIASGRSNREIAERLVLSERTVERHIANIYEKLSFHGKAARAAVAAYALQHHLAGPESEHA